MTRFYFIPIYLVEQLKQVLQKVKDLGQAVRICVRAVQRGSEEGEVAVRTGIFGDELEEIRIFQSTCKGFLLEGELEELHDPETGYSYHQIAESLGCVSFPTSEIDNYTDFEKSLFEQT